MAMADSSKMVVYGVFIFVPFGVIAAARVATLVAEIRQGNQRHVRIESTLPGGTSLGSSSHCTGSHFAGVILRF